MGVYGETKLFIQVKYGHALQGLALGPKYFLSQTWFRGSRIVSLSKID